MRILGRTFESCAPKATPSSDRGHRFEGPPLLRSGFNSGHGRDLFTAFAPSKSLASMSYVQSTDQVDTGRGGALVALDVEHLELADYCRSRKMIAPSRQRFTPPSQGELTFTHGSTSAAVVAPVVRPGAYQFCRNDLDAVSVGRFGPIVTAKHHSHPSHRSTRSICDLFKISSINSLRINHHHRQASWPACPPTTSIRRRQ